jgi:Secretion system C-terminal sorting domain
MLRRIGTAFMLRSKPTMLADYRTFTRDSGVSPSIAMSAGGALSRLRECLLILLIAPAIIFGQTYFTVTGTGDGSSTSKTGSGTAGSPYQIASLRGALLYIDANKLTVSPAVINLPAGTITIGSNLFVATSGSQTITINGDPTSGTTINGANAHIPLNIDYSASGGTNITVTNVTLTAGRDSTDGYGGAAILDGTGFTTPPLDQLTLTNCTITNCASTHGSGGALAMWGGTVTITNCTFSNNSETGVYGGAIFFGTGGTMSISNSTFSGNSVTATSSGIPASGGAIYFSGSGTGLTITNTSFSSNSATDNINTEADGGAIWLNSGNLSFTRCSFTNNSVTATAGSGYGGAIFCANSSSAAISYSRFTGNTASTGGNAIRAGVITLTANDNWWGQNSGPGGSDLSTSSATITTTTYLQLRLAPARNTITTSDTTLLTADILGRNSGGLIAASNLSGLPTFPSSFGSAALGTLSSQTQFVNGIATAKYTSGSSIGTGSAQVTADNQTVTVSPTVSVIASVTFADGSAYTPPAPVQNSSDNPVGRFELTGSATGADLTGVTISFSGTGTNVTGVKLWQSTDASFGGDTQIGTTQSYGSTVTFSGLSAAIPTGGTYFFVTLDLGTSVGSTVQKITDNSAILLSNGALTGTISNAVLSAADVSLPVQVSSFVAEASDNSVSLSWETQSEVSNAGFNILRRDPGTSAFKLISSYVTDDSLKGLGTSSAGRRYNFTDNRVTSGAKYEYKIQSVSTKGTTADLNTLAVTVDVPKTYALYQNYPNPFNPTTTISYQLAAVSHVTLKIYDVLGRELTTLADGRENAGVYRADFNGAGLPSGVYFYRLLAVQDDGHNYAFIKKLILMK